MKLAATKEQLPVRVAVLATAAAVLLGVAARTLRAAAGWEFPVWQETAVELTWMLGLVVAVIIGFRSMSGRLPGPRDLGFGPPDVTGDEHRRRRRVAARGVLACVAALALISMASRGHGSGGTAPPEDLRTMSLAFLVVTFVVRWPVSVVAQQVLFFGWLQPRLGRASRALPATAALYSASHLVVPGSLVFVVPLGFIFALQRWETGRVRAGAATHYAINILLFAATVTAS